MCRRAGVLVLVLVAAGCVRPEVSAQRESVQRRGSVEVHVEPVSAKSLPRDHPLHHRRPLEAGPTLFRIRLVNHSERMVSAKFYGVALTTQADLASASTQATQPSVGGAVTRPSASGAGDRPTSRPARGAAGPPCTMPAGARGERAWLDADGRVLCLVDVPGLAEALARVVSPEQKVAVTRNEPAFQKRVQAAWESRWRVSQLLPGFPEQGLLIFEPLRQRPQKLVFHLVVGGERFEFRFSVTEETVR